MNLKLTYLCFVGLFLMGTLRLYGQASEVTITGKVIEEKTQQAMEFVTVLIGDKQTKKPITGTTTDGAGNFVIKTTARNFYIEVRFIGFDAKTITEYQIVNNKIALGEVALVESAEALQEMTITAEKSQTEFRLDKRVFNVGKDLSTTGASALEVLNNVPSVNVNIEGQISLRGSEGVQVLINGKPSILASEEGNALGTITADMIEKIEVITNPSAKYDAEGSSGIINIVLKKEEKKGLNGSITLNTGVPNNHSVGVSLNKRTEKFNLFSQFGVGRRTLPTDLESINRDFVNDTELTSLGRREKNETFYNVILGTDYHINDFNVITLSGNFAFEKEDESSELHFDLYEDDVLTNAWDRVEATTADNPKWQYELQYKKGFKNNKDRELLFSALGNFFGKDQESTFSNNQLVGVEEIDNQETRTDFKEARYTFKLDYTHPISKKYTVETGAQYVLNNVTNDFAVNDLINGEWVNNVGLTNVFDYNQNVLGLYTTGAYEGEKWGVKLGVRMEHTYLYTLLENTNEENIQRFTNLFPSFHTSYKITDQHSIQAGYSKRIYRPRLWSLNPFFNIRNNFNISAGNPNLLPEFTDSYEINSIHELKDLSFNFGLYFRYTTDAVERIATFEDGVSITRPINTGTNSTTGVEFNAKYNPVDWFTINADFNYNYFQRKGSFEQTSFDFTADRWSSRATAKFKLPFDTDVELIGNYRSGFQTVQGEVRDNLFLNFGARKRVLKGKVVVNFSVRDVFATRISQREAGEEDFYLFNSRQRGRFIILGASYGFGKGEAMHFSGRRRF
ncbi:MAG: TonB-dependent receptor domain-containing protein [Flammeovirgaceae bacterium]